MKRRNFLRNVVLGIAASLVPKILQPMDTDCLFDVKRMNKMVDEHVFEHDGKIYWSSLEKGKAMHLFSGDKWLFIRNYAYNK